MKRSYTKLEKELFKFLKCNNAVIQFLDLWREYRIKNTCRYKPLLSIHQNLLNQDYGYYVSPKDIIWFIFRHTNLTTNSSSVRFFDKLATKWEKYYFTNKICSKTCKNCYGYIQEIEYLKKDKARLI